MRVRRPVPPFPPPPSGAALPGQTPERRRGCTPTKRCVSRIADGWGSVVAAVLRGCCPQFACPGVWEGWLSVRFPFLPPSVAWCCCSDIPDLLDSGGSPSLRWTKDMKLWSIHTQAVQPSYSWARLSMLVASLMTKSTCRGSTSQCC